MPPLHRRGPDTLAEEIEQFSVVYDGGLATTGQLHFYEYGRAAYAVARLVATIEHFRRTGRVAQRISSRSYVDVIIRAPEKGSFPIDMLIPIGDAIKHASELSGIPVGDFVKYVIHLVTRLLPKQETQALEIAKISLDHSKEETKRTKEIRKMVESGNVNTLAAINALQSMIGVSDRRLDAIGATQQSMGALLQTLTEARQREEEFEPYRERLEGIDPRKLARLARKVRPQIGEAGLPLRRSATQMRLAQGADKRVFATLRPETLKDIVGNSLDNDSHRALVRFISYDRDQGTGKCDLVEENLQRVTFSVPVNVRRRVKKLILAALEDDAVEATIRYFRNRDDMITSLLVEGINDQWDEGNLEDDDEDLI